MRWASNLLRHRGHILGQITGMACLSSLKNYQLASATWQKKA
jgi:hypothetical protein